MPYRSIATLAALFVLVVSSSRAATEEYWYFVAQDGCSEYLYYNDELNHIWKVWWKCCGQSTWCYDSHGQADPCSSGMIVPKPGTEAGTSATYNTAGDLVASVAPGHGGHIGTGEDKYLPFYPDGSSVLTIPGALLQ